MLYASPGASHGTLHKKTQHSYGIKTFVFEIKITSKINFFVQFFNVTSPFSPFFAAEISLTLFKFKFVCSHFLSFYS